MQNQRPAEVATAATAKQPIIPGVADDDAVTIRWDMLLFRRAVESAVSSLMELTEDVTVVKAGIGVLGSAVGFNSIVFRRSPPRRRRRSISSGSVQDLLRDYSSVRAVGFTRPRC